MNQLQDLDQAPQIYHGPDQIRIGEGNNNKTLAIPIEAKERNEANIELFEKADIATNSEVAIVLSTLLSKDHMVEKSMMDGNIISQKARPVVQKALNFASKFGQVSTLEANEQMKRLLRGMGATEYEMGSWINLMPQKYDELVKLIPTLEDGRFTERQLEDALNDIKAYANISHK